MCRLSRGVRSRIAATFCIVLVAATAEAAGAKSKLASPALPPGSKLSASELTRRVDDALDVYLQGEKVQPAPRSDDAEFIRRIYLDLTGHIPPAEKVIAFLDDRRTDKRARLIDALLDDADYGKHQAEVWQALFTTRNSDNRRINFEPLRTWLEERFNKNQPWDALVRDLLTASGKQDENGAVTYFLANLGPDKATDNVTKVLLGVQLQCAQCHNHPFTGWKQTEYWGMAAFFMKVQPLGFRPGMMMNGEGPGIRDGNFVPRRLLPESAKMLPAKFLGGDEAKVQAGDSPRPALAAWLTAADNPYFSRALVNRTWANLFGRGLVNPVDDMHDANPASHPQLLADLANQFTASDFDLKHLVRALCNTRAYQRTSKPVNGTVDAAPELYARMAVKVLTPEQLFDSLGQALGGPLGQGPGMGRFGKGMQQAQALAQFRGGMFNPRALFVSFFKSEGDNDPTEYQAGIPQALRLMNAGPLNNAIGNSALSRSTKPTPQAVQDLYLATLSRRPKPRELERAVAHVREQRDSRQGLSDVLWALVNSSEFTLNH